MSRTTTAVALACISVLLIGLSGVAAGGGTVMVRFVNALWESGEPLDLYMDGTPLIENVAYGEISDQVKVPAGVHDWSAHFTGDGSFQGSSGGLQMDAGTAWTFASYYLGGGFQGDRDKVNPGPASAFLRVWELSPTLSIPGYSHLTNEDGDLLQEVIDLIPNAYIEVGSGPQTLTLTDPQDADFTFSFDIDLKLGGAYTAFLMDIDGEPQTFIVTDAEPASVPDGAAPAPGSPGDLADVAVALAGLGVLAVLNATERRRRRA